LVHGQVTIIFVVSVGLSVCLSVCLFVCLCSFVDGLHTNQPENELLSQSRVKRALF